MAETIVVNAREEMVTVDAQEETAVVENESSVVLDSAVAIDATLTKSGHAADAKAAGDRIKNLSEQVGELSNLETNDKTSIVAAINEAAKTGVGVEAVPDEEVIAALAKNDLLYAVGSGDDVLTDENNNIIEW